MNVFLLNFTIQIELLFLIDYWVNFYDVKNGEKQLFGKSKTIFWLNLINDAIIKEKVNSRCQDTQNFLVLSNCRILSSKKILNTN